MTERIILPDINRVDMLMRSDLPFYLYSAAATRQLDACIIAAGIPGLELMQRAAAAVWDEMRRRWPETRQLTVLCGSGNNAGDGYLVALLAQRAGWQVEVLALTEPEHLRGDAAQAWQLACQGGVCIQAWPAVLPASGIVLDAMLGTGLNGGVREPFKSAIAAVNASGLPVAAVDLPSGLNADTGAIEGSAISADLTVSFIAMKPGLLTGCGPDLAGELCFAPLAELPEHTITPVLERLGLSSCKSLLPLRPRAAHKGMYGHLLLLGGNSGMGGAIMLAAETALRSGAGKVSVVTRSEHVAPLLARCPEVMALGLDEPSQLTPLLEQATAIVVGPGLGRDDWARRLLELVLQYDVPRILDADALNILAARPKWLGNKTVVTPHPAEAGRLLGCSAADVQNDRLLALNQLVERFGCAVVLKGVGSLVADAELERLPGLCPYGNPGMATAGMGDVLSGLIGALLAQGLSAGSAARYAVLLHALAGDRSEQQYGQLGMLASDLIEHIRYYLNLRDIR